MTRRSRSSSAMSSASVGRTVRYLEAKSCSLPLRTVGDDGGLDFGLGCGWIFRQAEKFKDVGILDEVTDGGFCRECFGCADGGGLGGEQPLVSVGLDLALELADAPVFPRGLPQVIVASLQPFPPHDQSVVAPGQFATQCVANLHLRVSEVKLAKIPEIGVREALAEFGGEGAGKFRRQPVAVGGFLRSALLFLHDPSADLPIGGDHGGIDGRVSGAPGIGKDAAHVGEEVGGWGKFVRHDSGGEAEDLFEVVHGGDAGFDFGDDLMLFGFGWNWCFHEMDR